MVNGNYVLYGDRPSSESEVVEDHVQTRTAERKSKRKVNRTAADLHRSLNLLQLDNDTDSVKYEKKIKEPRLLRYVSNKDVEENFVTEKFETYDLNASEGRPRKYAFQKKPKNSSDGSVNYAYSRSSSSCSSPNGNLPTISEHGEQYSTYRVHSLPGSSMGEIFNDYEAKLDKYFKQKDNMKYPDQVGYEGTHPDSLYRVPTDDTMSSDRVAKILRLLRWPLALITACIALAVFIFFLMPDNIDKGTAANGTYFRALSKSLGRDHHKDHHKDHQKEIRKGFFLSDIILTKEEKNDSHLPEIDFYDSEIESDITTLPDIEPVQKTVHVKPVFPTFITPEVQYGNEKADTNPRAGKTLTTAEEAADSTLKPHITLKAEKPLEVTLHPTTESIKMAETITKYKNYEKTEAKKPTTIKQYITQTTPEIQGLDNRELARVDVTFTSGHSKLFGISIEDAERMKSTTQNSLYHTRVSPTLPTWHEGDDLTTKKYPDVVNEVPHCRSTSLPLCRGVLPYDLAGAPAKLSGVDVTTLLPQIEYLVSSNCSFRFKQFACALLEPECNAPPYPVKKPCHNLCKTITEVCDGFIPRELGVMFNCNQYPHSGCINAKVPCFKREFPCSDGSCVPKHWRCDNNNDCPLGEDEAACSECTSNEYRCDDGTCIPKRWLCDGYADCADGRDEAEACEYAAPGGEPAAGGARAPAAERGSAPAASESAPEVRVPAPFLGTTGDLDNSKELLVTSDSNNALKRNFTMRRLPASRLQPYTRKKVVALGLPKNEAPKRVELPNTASSTTLKPVYNSSMEELNSDLEFLEDLKKISKENLQAKDTSIITTVDKDKKNLAAQAAALNPPLTTRLDKSIKKLEKVINGAELLKKALADVIPTDSAETNATSFDDEVPMEPVKDAQKSSHSSPCPSDELRCVDGRCITLAQLCDGTIDCSDHADEDNCYT